jgi:hypothetical protein
VNYELAFLPGDPEVCQIPYPNDSRRYFRSGDPILLLQYRNHPYRIVYDTIKVIDDNSAIGVMHLGSFPDGMEFATFVMERHNYPFQNMSVEDHRLAFADPRCRALGGNRGAAGKIILPGGPAEPAEPSQPYVVPPAVYPGRREGEARQFEFCPTRWRRRSPRAALRFALRRDADVRNNMLIGRWTGPEFHPLLMREWSYPSLTATINRDSVPAV